MTATQGSAGPIALSRRPAVAAASTGRNGPGWPARLGTALMTLALGTVIGLALTAVAIKNGAGIGETRIGAWRYAPGEGSPDPNPYQLASLARTGTLPMSNGQGVALTATRDGSGKRLDRGCTYTLKGPVQRARFWTLTVDDPDGFPLANAAGRQALTSDDIVRDETGAFSIVLSTAVQPGNWLPLTGKGPFVLTLRLYDSAVGPDNRAVATLPVPTIVVDGCP